MKNPIYKYSIITEYENFNLNFLNNFKLRNETEVLLNIFIEIRSYWQKDHFVPINDFKNWHHMDLNNFIMINLTQKKFNETLHMFYE